VTLLWLIIGAVLAIAEVFTTTLVLIMFAAGAFAAAGAAALGLPLELQIVAFGVVAAAALAGARPALRRHLQSEPQGAPIGLAALEGASALVLERIDQDHGRIKVDGEQWTARPFDATQVFEAGDRVRVIEIKGATALVWKE
jgi:membrane protein implicated in regulation of membrane protease activity